MTKPDLVVADAGPLIHLEELGVLDLLGDYATVVVPDAVWQEVQRHRPLALLHPAINLVKEFAPLNSEQINAVATLYTLHHGEHEALALCLQHDDSLFLTDDNAARLAAKSLNIKVHGTLGILIRAVRRKLRTPTQVVSLLSVIPKKTTLHIRPSLLNDIVDQVKAEWGIDHE